jgi:hypothetical protein
MTTLASLAIPAIYRLLRSVSISVRVPGIVGTSWRPRPHDCGGKIHRSRWTRWSEHSGPSCNGRLSIISTSSSYFRRSTSTTNNATKRPTKAGNAELKLSPVMPKKRSAVILEEYPRESPLVDSTETGTTSTFAEVLMARSRYLTIDFLSGEPASNTRTNDTRCGRQGKAPIAFPAQWFMIGAVEKSRHA